MGEELLYSLSSPVIVLCLFALMIGMIILGVLAGRRDRRHHNTIDAQASAMQAAMLGLLALILGFTFSLALSRHNDRSVALMVEANAIGTAWLNTDLLSDARRDTAKGLMRAYGAARIQALDTQSGDVNLQDHVASQTDKIFAQIWAIAVTEARATPGPAAVLIVTSLSDMNDHRAEFQAVLDRHVPELVLLLLFATFLIVSWTVGYAEGAAGSTPRSPVFSMFVLILVLVYIIIDLDRPRRGMITIDQSHMFETVAAMSK